MLEWIWVLYWRLKWSFNFFGLLLAYVMTWACGLSNANEWATGFHHLLANSKANFSRKIYIDFVSELTFSK